MSGSFMFNSNAQRQFENRDCNKKGSWWRFWDTDETKLKNADGNRPEIDISTEKKKTRYESPFSPANRSKFGL